MNTVGHQCNKWPITLACGYGRPVPSNRFLASRQDGALDSTPALLMMYGASMCMGADGSACGACGSCGACDKLIFLKQIINNILRGCGG
jgi:hypothetical protein